jgi:catechol 2,3-dioxygenase-like lactoylglutathione lyase family enzyme
VQIDHVLFGVNDLADGTAWFEESFGLTAVSGGAHPAWGTANAILAVGRGQYVELIAVVDPASEHPLARVLRSMVSDGDRPVAVCLRPDDLDVTAQHLGLEISEGTRTNPDGATLRWRMAGLPAALGPDRLPFFIEWPGGGATPELDGVSSADGDGVEWIEIGGDPATVEHWLGGDLPTVRRVGGPPGIGRFGIRRGDRSVMIGAR